MEQWKDDKIFSGRIVIWQAHTLHETCRGSNCLKTAAYTGNGNAAYACRRKWVARHVIRSLKRFAQQKDLAVMYFNNVSNKHRADTFHRYAVVTGCYRQTRLRQAQL